MNALRVCINDAKLAERLGLLPWGFHDGRPYILVVVAGCEQRDWPLVPGAKED